jgi:hypothetical protein
VFGESGGDFETFAALFSDFDLSLFDAALRIHEQDRGL